MTAPEIIPSRLLPSDVWRVAVAGIRARTSRAALSCLGIAIGIGSLVGVLGLSESSKSDLIDQLDALGTNLLAVSSGQGFGVGDNELPETAAMMIGRLPTVETVSAVAELPSGVHRNEFVPEEQTGALTVIAADDALLTTLNGAMASGTFLEGAGLEYPVAVLGSVAADRLAIEHLDDRAAVVIDGQRVEVVGVMEPFPLAADLDRSVIVSTSAAEAFLVEDLSTSTIYVRTHPGSVVDTRDVLPATADPQNPEEVEVTRPSDVIEAQAAAESAFTSLFLGLGLVALVVGGIGIANVMVIGVIERRGEIGLRRAIGGTKRQVRVQFLSESLLLGILGGVAGVALGSAVTAVYAMGQGWRVIIPPIAPIGGIGAAVAIGGLAGLYPAMRAARMSPTEALRAD